MNNDSYEHTVIKFSFTDKDKERIAESIKSFLAIHLPDDAVRYEDHSYDLYMTGKVNIHILFDSYFTFSSET